MGIKIYIYEGLNICMLIWRFNIPKKRIPITSQRPCLCVLQICDKSAKRELRIIVGAIRHCDFSFCSLLKKHDFDFRILIFNYNKYSVSVQLASIKEMS